MRAPDTAPWRAGGPLRLLAAPRAGGAGEPAARIRPTASGGRRGFTLLEILLVVLILAMAILPMMGAFGPALTAGVNSRRNVVCSNQARGTLARMQALPFDTLDANRGDPASLAALFGGASEALKESFTHQGMTMTPVAAIRDASGGAGGLLELRVTVGDVTLRTLKASY